MEAPAVLVKIDLGDISVVAQLFSYPNVPGSSQTLAQTVAHWFSQTLDRDGFAAQGATCQVSTDGGRCVLVLQGPPSLALPFERYQAMVPAILTAGYTALDTDIPAVKAAGLWDPKGDGWRFFLPLGLPMVSQRSVQLFHYPPMGLLNPLQDYLNDPVPVRWEELLEANGAPSRQQARLLETIVDSAPVAASDDQGSYISPMLQPKDYFQDYQLSLLRLLLTDAGRGYTVPLVVLGAPARAVFQTLFGVHLGVNTTTVASIVPGLKTAVLGANHPYAFYATAQGFENVGSGTMIPGGCQKAAPMMVQDLISACWQWTMSNNPSADPQAVLNAGTAYWQDQAQKRLVCALVQRHGSLYYIDKDPAKFVFNVSLDEGAAFCDAHDCDPCANLWVERRGPAGEAS